MVRSEQSRSRYARRLDGSRRRRPRGGKKTTTVASAEIMNESGLAAAAEKAYAQESTFERPLHASGAPERGGAGRIEQTPEYLVVDNREPDAMKPRWRPQWGSPLMMIVDTLDRTDQAWFSRRAHLIFKLTKKLETENTCLNKITAAQQDNGPPPSTRRWPHPPSLPRDF